MKYPEVRIEYAWLLGDNVSQYLNQLWGDGTPLRSYEEYQEVAENYTKAWQPYEKKILRGMCNTLGLSFHQNTIDVHIAPWMHAFSSPMVIGVNYKPDRFIEILTHEMIHRLLTDNNESAYDMDHVKEWQELFGKEPSKNTLVHIPVHAVMRAVFDDVLQEPERTKHDKKLCEQWPDYDAAWKYVDQVGYKKIIEQLRESYKKQSERRAV